MDRLTTKIFRRWRLVPGSGLSLPLDRHLCGTCHDHDRTVSVGTRHGPERLVGPRLGSPLARPTPRPSRSPMASARERHSSAMLQQPTLGDLLRIRSGGRSTVVSLSIKPRSAIALAGQHGQNVDWLDEANTSATSTAFADTLVSAIGRYVDQHPIESDVDRVWTRVLPMNLYQHDDDEHGETPPLGWTRTFPHPMDAGLARTTRFSSAGAPAHCRMPISPRHGHRHGTRVRDGFWRGDRLSRDRSVSNRFRRPSIWIGQPRISGRVGTPRRSHWPASRCF
jgi:hypothetical protein